MGGIYQEKKKKKFFGHQLQFLVIARSYYLQALETYMLLQRVKSLSNHFQ